MDVTEAAGMFKHKVIEAAPYQFMLQEMWQSAQ